MRPMHSLITLRWNQGGRNVSSATIQRGGKMTKLALARPGTSLGEVRTVKMDGSGWSKLTVPIALKRARSYFQGARLQCQATTSRGLRSEEHTSELKSLMRTSYAVYCWKKKQKDIIDRIT